MRKLFSLFLALVATTSLWAYDFQSGNLYYNITSGSTVEVTYQQSSSSNYSGLTIATIPETVTYDGITYSVTRIGERAFEGCFFLTSVTIPASVISIEEYNFYHSYISTVYLKSTTPPILNGGKIFITSRPTCYIPCGTLDTYKASKWANLMSQFVEECEEDSTNIITYTSSDGKVVKPYKTDAFGANIVSNEYKDGQGVITFDGPVTSIGWYAFSHCSSLTSMTIPNSVTSIGDFAFYYCYSLTSVTIGNSVTSIGNYAFEGCPFLTSVNIPNSVMSIGFDAFDDTGIYNDESNWDNDVLYIDECLITTKDSSIVSYIIKDSTRLIANGAFEDCMLLTSITIPNSVITIGAGAFEGCSALTSLVIPNSVISIGNNAFSLCTSLESVIISEGIKSIGGHVFSDCTNLRSLTIPKSVTSLGDDYIPIAVRVPNLSSIYVAEGNSVYDSRNNCNAIIETATNTLLMGCQNTVIPNDIKRIERAAFMGAITLTTIDIPTSVDSIGYAAFVNTGITKIAIPSNTIIEDTPYNNYGIDPSSGEITATGAFSDCKQLTDVSLPEGMTSIPTHMFSLCSSLESINIPSSVTTIKRNAFSDCISLTTITIPENVSSIERCAFENCSALTDVYVKVTTPPALDLLYDTNVFTSSPICHIPCGTKAAYEASAWASQVSEFVEDCYSNQKCGDNLYWEYNDTQLSITGHGDMYDYDIEPQPWMQYRSKMQTISMPEGMTSIGASAFANCKYVKSIAIPASVEKISDSAFEDCRMLSTITFAGSSVLTHIGNWAFYNNHELTSITIPEGVIEIGYAAFYGCTYLDELTLPASMEYIADNGFALCAKLRRINVNASTPPVVEARTFEDVDRSIPVYVPNTSIELYKAAPVWQEFNIVGKNNTTTDVDNIHSPITNYHKLIRNGQLLILREGKTYNAMGQEVDN